MARAPVLLPTVFVGCPYSKPFKFAEFKKSLDHLPFAWYYANTRLKTTHLLSILTTYIKAVDFCIFDLSPSVITYEPAIYDHPKSGHMNSPCRGGSADALVSILAGIGSST